MRHLERRHRSASSGWQVVPGSVTQIAYLRLGGFDQSVMIRGESVANPPVILLHGGPGWSETAFWRYWTRRLRRASPLSIGISAAPASRLTAASLIVDDGRAVISRISDDLVEAAASDSARQRGDLWALLGLSLRRCFHAARFPEKVAAYVGSGQTGDSRRGRRRDLVRVRASPKPPRLGNRSAISEAAVDGPRHTRPMRCSPSRTWLSRFEGRMRPRGLWKVARAVSAGGSLRSSSCPAQCAASGSP